MNYIFILITYHEVKKSHLENVDYFVIAVWGIVKDFGSEICAEPPPPTPKKTLFRVRLDIWTRSQKLLKTALSHVMPVRLSVHRYEKISFLTIGLRNLTIWLRSLTFKF
jgi:hypothetical protein